MNKAQINLALVLEFVFSVVGQVCSAVDGVDELAFFLPGIKAFKSIQLHFFRNFLDARVFGEISSHFVSFLEDSVNEREASSFFGNVNWEGPFSECNSHQASSDEEEGSNSHFW